MDTESAPLRLFAIVRKNHGHDAWVHINPMYADLLRLAITSKMAFALDDFATIVHCYNAGHWMGPDDEVWYRLTITSGHPSSVLSIEAWMRRAPFLLDGERVYVGRTITWEGGAYRITSIESDRVRAKRDEYAYNAETKAHAKLPETLITIPREGFEAKIAADKAAAAAKRAAEREANRADPIDLLPVAEHMRTEVPRTKVGARYGWGARFRAPDSTEFAEFGSDYKRAWNECSDYARQDWARAIGIIGEHSDADASKASWPKVEQAIFRFVRTVRGLPLRGDS